MAPDPLIDELLAADCAGEQCIGSRFACWRLALLREANLHLLVFITHSLFHFLNWRATVSREKPKSSFGMSFAYSPKPRLSAP